MEDLFAVEKMVAVLIWGNPSPVCPRRPPPGHWLKLGCALRIREKDFNKQLRFILCGVCRAMWPVV